ncbi:hypothetical protein WN944_024517 [Citrus x changshan-huyou]|uniref:Uncharacterized protein n=1 Tax=Citrus x changshan-huyou TaxID=2935761 RepID=A0AAP0LUD8_9ROSI
MVNIVSPTTTCQRVPDPTRSHVFSSDQSESVKIRFGRKPNQTQHVCCHTDRSGLHKPRIHLMTSLYKHHLTFNGAIAHNLLTESILCFHI